MREGGVELEAQEALLTVLLKDPAKIFDLDGKLLDESDFQGWGARCVYAAIRSLAGQHDKIDAVLVEEAIAGALPVKYRENRERIRSLIDKVASAEPPGKPGEYAKIVSTSAAKRKAVDKLRSLIGEVKDLGSREEVIAHVEGRVMEFSSSQFRSSGFIKLGDNYNDYVIGKQKMREAGRAVGVSSGYPLYDEAIGGGHRPGTIDIVAARAKTGKSLFAMNVAYNVASLGVPVLYMDTELNKDIQTTRLLSTASAVPMHYLDTAKFLGKSKYREMIKSCRKAYRALPIYYETIGGWKLQRQVSLVRSWFSRHVGREADGAPRPCLVILDYLKIMDQGDRRFDFKEYEVLGYHFSVLHDLVQELGVAMFSMVQQNRSGLEEEHEGTVSGSDRFSWFCDSLSFLVPRRDEDVEADYEDPEREASTDPPNLKMKVKLARHGPGNPGNECIMYYTDIKNPRMCKTMMTGKFSERGVERHRPRRRARAVD